MDVPSLRLAAPRQGKRDIGLIFGNFGRLAFTSSQFFLPGYYMPAVEKKGF